MKTPSDLNAPKVRAVDWAGSESTMAHRQTEVLAPFLQAWLPGQRLCIIAPASVNVSPLLQHGLQSITVLDPNRARVGQALQHSPAQRHGRTSVRIAPWRDEVEAARTSYDALILLWSDELKQGSAQVEQLESLLHASFPLLRRGGSLLVSIPNPDQGRKVPRAQSDGVGYYELHEMVRSAEPQFQHVEMFGQLPFFAHAVARFGIETPNFEVDPSLVRQPEEAEFFLALAGPRRFEVPDYLLVQWPSHRLRAAGPAPTLASTTSAPKPPQRQGQDPQLETLRADAQRLRDKLRSADALISGLQQRLDAAEKQAQLLPAIEAERKLAIERETESQARCNRLAEQQRALTDDRNKLSAKCEELLVSLQASQSAELGLRKELAAAQQNQDAERKAQEAERKAQEAARKAQEAARKASDIQQRTEADLAVAQSEVQRLEEALHLQSATLRETQELLRSTEVLGRELIVRAKQHPDNAKLQAELQQLRWQLAQQH